MVRRSAVCNLRDDVPLVMVITDIGKDIDDAMALSILCYADAVEKRIQILSVVANLKSAELRANRVKGFLDSMGCPEVDVGTGTVGSSEDHFEREYEYDNVMRSDINFFQGGLSLMKSVLERLRVSNRKARVVCISSLRDISELCEEDPQLVKSTIESFHIQGGVRVAPNGAGIVPSVDASNNRFDMEAATSFYSFVYNQSIKCTVCTKQAAFASKLPADLVSNLLSINGKVSMYMYRQISEQMMIFYRQSCGPEPYAPYMDKEWWVRNITVWYDENPGMPAPEDEDILNYVRIPPYDVVAALSAMGNVRDIFRYEPKRLLPAESTGEVYLMGGPPLGSSLHAEESVYAAGLLISQWLIRAVRWADTNVRV